MQLHQLRASARNKSAARRFEVKAAADAATVWIYDFIGYDPWTQTGVSAEEIAKELAAVTAPTIHVRINSPGGSVFDGRAIHAALKAHPASKLVTIEGVAASAATFIAMAGDKIEMAKGSLFMIHNAWTVAAGNAEEFLSTAALLEKIDGTLVEDYASKTGASVDQIKAWMAAETWFTAEEAKAAGFVDTVTDGEDVAARWDLGAYAKAPKAPEPAEAGNDFEWAAANRSLRLVETTSA